MPTLELKQPATVSDAQAAFRAAWAAGTGQLITSQTQKFLNDIIEDRACVFKFQVMTAHRSRGGRNRHLAVPLSLCLSRCASLAAPPSLCLSRCAFLAVPFSLFLPR